MRHCSHVGVAALVGLLAACGEEAPRSADKRVAFGPVAAGGGELFTWARLERELVVEIGLTLSRQAVEGARDPFDVFVPLPEPAREQSFARYVHLIFAPAGDGERYPRAAHFDVRWFRLSAAERDGIDCVDEREPDSEVLPDGFSVLSTSAEPDGTCALKAGVRVLQQTSLIELDSWTWAFAFHQGLMSFFGPLIARDFLASGGSIDAAVPAPGSFRFSTRWPQRMTLRFADDQDAFELALGELKAVD